MTKPLPLLYSAKEACRMLGIGVSMFYELHSSGRLGPMAHKLGRRSLWNRQELERWVEAGMPPRDRWLGVDEQGGGSR